MFKRIQKEDLLPDEYPENIGYTYRTEQRNDFHIGQSYDDEPCQTVICDKCNSDKFIVGEGSYFTAIKCINCGWEICIHDG